MAATRVLLLVTGGIAAYKSCFLTRLLVQAGFSVKVAMTAAAQRFVSPMTFQVLSQHPVAIDLWGEGPTDALDHIEYARWADLAVVAPATADLLGKAAAGVADDIVTTLLLAYPGTLIVAPAMNDNMWRHPATVANAATLRERGVVLIGPGEGSLACGVASEGRMAEPEAIFTVVREQAAALAPRKEAAPESSAADPSWRGRHVVVTAGPTHEPIDPVRYLANRSSGAFGYALAAEAVRRGARVTLISGPTQLIAPRGLTSLVPVTTAAQMAEAVSQSLDAKADWLIMAAAVADFAPQPQETKVKKELIDARWQLELVPTTDILADVVRPRKRGGLRVVGFALETENLLAAATAKLKAKGLDFIVANDPTADGAGFGAVDHRVTLVGRSGIIWESESQPKAALARELFAQLAAATTTEAGS
jgi:phosphopantothenoylcysteine decarboxylase/phosphopantothenate--cysteine ligase